MVPEPGKKIQGHCCSLLTMKAFSGTTAELCRRVAASFPSPISYGFAYGSAVALQDGTAAGKMYVRRRIA